MESATPTSSPQTPQTRLHETSDVSVGGIVIFAVALAIFVVVIAVGTWAMMRHMHRDDLRADLADGRAQSPVADRRSGPPEPELQPSRDTHPTMAWQDREHLDRRNRQILNSYGWVGRDKAVARIPLDAALELIVQNGLPAKLPATAPGTQGAAAGCPTTSLTPTLPPVPGAAPTGSGQGDQP